MSHVGREAPPAVVRKATPADLSAVQGLVSAAGLQVDGLAEAALVLVADQAGVVVGTVALEEHRIDGDTAFLLRSAAVSPARRDCGVGAALIAAAIAHAERGGAPVALLTETADRYFLRFGFLPVGRDRLPLTLAGSDQLRGACPDSAQAMLRLPDRGRRS